jgi:hypothetical protein
MSHHRPILHLIPIQTMNHPLVPPPILTNHTPLINSPYQHLTLYVNEGLQPYFFPYPPNHAHVQPFSPSILVTILVQYPPLLPPHLDLGFIIKCLRILSFSAIFNCITTLLPLYGMMYKWHFIFHWIS